MIMKKIEKEFKSGINFWEVDQILVTYPEHVLERAYRQYKKNDNKHYGLKSFKKNIEWAEEYFEKTRAKTNDNPDSDLVERKSKYFQMIDKIKDDNEKICADAKEIYKHLSEEGKKLVIDAFLNDLVKSSMLIHVWQKTRMTMCDDAMALTFVYVKYISDPIFFEKISKYAQNEKTKFDSFAYYEKRLDEELEKQNRKRTGNESFWKRRTRT